MAAVLRFARVLVRARQAPATRATIHTVPDALTLAVQDVLVHTPTTRVLTLSLGDTPFSYKAGQGVALGRHGQPERRPYSVAAAPHDAARSGTLEFLLRTDAQGLLGRHLDGLAPGVRVDVEGPFGEFTLPEPLPHTPLLFVAGGTGIAPLRAMAREAVRRGHAGPMDVVYSVRSADDLAYADEWTQWVADGRGRLALTVTRGDVRPRANGGPEVGRLDSARLAPFVRAAPHVHCFVCGPPAFVDDLVQALSHLGVPADRIRREGW